MVLALVSLFIAQAPQPKSAGVLLLATGANQLVYADGARETEANWGFQVESIVKVAGRYYGVWDDQLFTLTSIHANPVKEPVRGLGGSISSIASSGAGGLFVTVGGSVPEAFYLRAPDSAPIRMENLQFGDHYGSLMISCVAVEPAGRKLAVGAGPDIYMGELESDAHEALARGSLQTAVSTLTRVAACGFVALSKGASQELTAARSICWSPTGRELIAYFSRVRGSGIGAAYLLREKAEGWHKTELRGHKFAWSPDGKVIAVEREPVPGTVEVILLKAGTLAFLRRYEDRRLIGWL